MKGNGADSHSENEAAEKVHEGIFYGKIRRKLGRRHRQALKNLDWLYDHMHPYFFITMKEEMDTIVSLAERLGDVVNQRKVTLTDREEELIVARLDIPGSLYDTLKTIQERGISYAEMTHSYEPLPHSARALEIQRFEFDRKSHDEVTLSHKARLPRGLGHGVADIMWHLYPEYNFKDLNKDLNLIALNNENYVRISPFERIARILWLYQQGIKHGGLYLDVEAKTDKRLEESRILFSVGNPPQKGFLTQVGEVFQRLHIGVRRSYSLYITTGVHYYFLGTFYVADQQGRLIDKDSDLFQTLQTELYNTQILAPSSTTYTQFVSKLIMTGEEASLINAFVEFCFTTLAHNQPDRYARTVIVGAFDSDPAIMMKLIDVFRKRFDPDMRDRQTAYIEALHSARQAIDSYNTGHRYRDETRKTIFTTSLIFICHILKTNFYVTEKHALAFRLDPAYLAMLDSVFTQDLPAGEPFRITFFYGRYGIGYHIGFSDIARGGWRTIISNSHDEYITNATTLFREVYVLAHTQHLKNKDIYEGGSKMTVVLNAADLESPDTVTQRLYKVQHGFINAFLDIFVTEKGKAKNPRVFDYYGDDEPIELGPDENMHDSMIELIAQLSVQRGYLLGIAIISSKRVGINHKEYGVTSRGLIKFAEVAMRERGIDITRNAFTVKITGGTNGDVAGNSMRLLLERCPHVKILSIAAGTGGLYDPEGVDREELDRLVLKHDVVDFNPAALHTGGYILFRGERKREGLRELYRKVARTDSGVEECWITSDEFHREFESLIFAVPADLFLPCGGRPETIDRDNWKRLFVGAENPTARVIAEGANSYITPEAREAIQKRGVVVLRDASANKCGVISSSYEIIANLLMSEKEFLNNKDSYVRDVLNILDRRAEEEARLIFKRYRESGGKLLYTEINRCISTEINDHYAKLFTFFEERPDVWVQPIFKRVILNHLPGIIRKNRRYRARLKTFPPKIISAILASEIASSIIYHGGWDVDFEKRLSDYLKLRFA